MVPAEPAANQVRSPVHAGQVVDRKYRVEGVLGAGGMGIVVSATHLALDEPVALKFMTLDEGRGDSTSRARFLREAKAARRLTSAHVARVFDVGQLATGEPYIVMELLQGDDLAKHLRTHGRLSASDTVRYILQVCDAIREAHALGIVHRDLKPQNLFLTRRSAGQPIIKVLDFGIAKSLEAAEPDASLTTSQNVVGSPIYMSPEQLRASKHVDERTDIWSIGVIMFELLSGKVPFVGDSVLELGMRIMTVPAPSLAALRAEVPAGLADVVQRCLEKEAAKRFPNVDSLVLALKPFAEVSHRSLPFADTMDEVPSSAFRSSTPAAEHLSTGGDLARTNGSIATGAVRPVRSRWTWALVAAVPVVLLAVAAIRPRGESTSVAPTAPTTAPTTAAASPVFHVEVRVHPAAARLKLDRETAGPSPFVRDLPRDGQPHSLAIDADGFEPIELSFRDVPPTADVTLRPLPQASPVDVAALAAVPTTSEPTSAVVSSRRLTAPKLSRPIPVGSSAPAGLPSGPTSTPVTTSNGPPRTTNDSPILR